MGKRIGIRNIIILPITIVNMLLGLAVSYAIVREYYFVLKLGNLGHFQFHSVPLDVGYATWAVLLLVTGVGILVRYFKNKPLPVVLPVAFFVVHLALYTISYIEG